MIPRDIKQSPKTRAANGAGPGGVFGAGSVMECVGMGENGERVGFINKTG
jgi:hypothetical protein